RLPAHRPHAGAQLEPIHPRHRPVENREAGRVVLLEDLPGLLTARGSDDLVAPRGQGRLVEATDDRLVVDDENSHVASAFRRSAQAGSAKKARTRSISRAMSATRSPAFSARPSCAASSRASADS